MKQRAVPKLMHFKYLIGQPYHTFYHRGYFSLGFTGTFLHASLKNWEIANREHTAGISTSQQMHPWSRVWAFQCGNQPHPMPYFPLLVPRGKMFHTYFVCSRGSEGCFILLCCCRHDDKEIEWSKHIQNVWKKGLKLRKTKPSLKKER